MPDVKDNELEGIMIGSLDSITEIGHAVRRMKKKIETSDKKIDLLDDHIRRLEIEVSRAEREIRILKA